MITNQQEFDAVALRLLDALGCRVPHDSQEEYREYIEVGEEALFIDSLANELEVNQVVLSPHERDEMRDLLGYYEMDPNNEFHARVFGRIVHRDRVVAALNVVGEP